MICWRRRGAGRLGIVTVALLAMAWESSGVLRAAPPTLRVVPSAAEQGASHRQAASTLDVAVALGGQGAVAVAPAAYAEDAAPAFPAAPVEAAAADAATREMEEIEGVEDGSQRRIFRPITQITVDAALPAGLLPAQTRDAEQIADNGPPMFGDRRLAGGWAENDFRWSATMFCHRPLYFEEVNLERYGYQCHGAVQPFVSGAHFFLTIPALPYLTTAQPPSECIYTLGHYRPGNRVPWRRHLPPCDARAAGVQAGMVVGLVFLIP